MRTTFLNSSALKACLVSSVAAIAMLPSIVLGQDETYGGFHHYSELPNVLFLIGDISNGDSFELRRAMRDHEIDLVVTASRGGNLYEGLQMASILRDKAVSTYVPAGASCESSCAAIFLGGQNRIVIGDLGVHQFFSSASDAAGEGRKDIMTAATQYTTSEVIGILNELETPPFVYEKMFGTLDIYYFKDVEKQRLSLNIDDDKFLYRLSEVDELLRTTQEPLARPPIETQSDEPNLEITTPAPRPTTGTKAPEEQKIFSDTDFFGADLNSQGLRNVSLYECESYCKKTPYCAAWSYVHATRWCWPKSGVKNMSMAANVTSGIVDFSRIDQDIFNRPFTEATALDIVGYDLYPKGLRNMSLDQCRHACQATENCIGFSYVVKQAWCFPKWGVGEYRKKLGIISGVVRED